MESYPMAMKNCRGLGRKKCSLMTVCNSLMDLSRDYVKTLCVSYAVLGFVRARGNVEDHNQSISLFLLLFTQLQKDVYKSGRLLEEKKRNTRIYRNIGLTQHEYFYTEPLRLPIYSRQEQD